MAGEIHNDFCEGSSDSGDDEDREYFLGRNIHPDKAFKLLKSLTEQRTMKLQCLRSRRRRKRLKPLAPMDSTKDGTTSSGKSRLEDEHDQSDTFSEVKSSSSFGTSNFLGNARKDLSAFDLHDDTPIKKNSLKLTHVPLTGNHSKGFSKLQRRPQPPKWRASSRTEHSSMSSLVSTVIRQDREDKASAAVHLPTGSREGQATQVPHQRGEEAVHLGNGKNGVSLDTDEPASPSHRKVGDSAPHPVFDFGSESDPDSPMDKSTDISLTSRIDDLQKFLAEDVLS